MLPRMEAPMVAMFRLNSAAKRAFDDKQVLFARDDDGKLVLAVNSHIGQTLPKGTLRPRISVDDIIINQFNLKQGQRFRLQQVAGCAVEQFTPISDAEEPVDIFEEREVPVFEERTIAAKIREPSFKYKFKPGLMGRPSSFNMIYKGVQNAVDEQITTERIQVGTRIERVKVGQKKSTKMVIEPVIPGTLSAEFQLIDIGMVMVGTNVSGDHPIVTVDYE